MNCILEFGEKTLHRIHRHVLWRQIAHDEVPFVMLLCYAQFVSLLSFQNALRDLARVRIGLVRVRVRVRPGSGLKFANCAGHFTQELS